MRLSAIVLLVTGLWAASASANSVERKFVCELTRIPTQVFTFSVKGLGTEGVELAPQNSPKAEGPVFTRSRNTTLRLLVETLNGQGGDPRTIRKGLHLFGDDVGCNFADLVLYKNSGYRLGYLSARYVCGGNPNESFYSTVRCSVSR
ncbi:MAG: hypothetical protein A2X94_16450 [Bdellovibrionales bacterium GWB1_55_8]|nr:MAG: hypothetical protein A2X94_16450 [Bdellovibrionales bacterium GWB1_55_8]